MKKRKFLVKKIAKNIEIKKCITFKKGTRV